MNKLQVRSRSWGVFSSLCLAFLPALGLSECLSELSGNDQTERFEILEGGSVVLDRWSGLAWSRCMLGEVWSPSSNRCEGDALVFAWADALAGAASAELAGWSDWRAPNVKELESIVDRACESPALNAEAFSGHTENVSASQWSSTQVESFALGAWTVNFKNGSVIPSEKDTLLSIRIVREP